MLTAADLLATTMVGERSAKHHHHSCAIQLNAQVGMLTAADLLATTLAVHGHAHPSLCRCPLDTAPLHHSHRRSPMHPRPPHRQRSPHQQRVVRIAPRTPGLPWRALISLSCHATRCRTSHTPWVALQHAETAAPTCHHHYRRHPCHQMMQPITLR